MRRMKRRVIHIFRFWITMLFNYQITCPFIVALTCISKVTQPKDIPLFSEAQVLLWASSLSLPFYLKVDWTWNNVASDEIINIIFLSVAWSTGTQLMTFFCFRFQEMLFGSPGHDLNLSRITSNMLSLQLCFFMELTCDLIVYRGNLLTNSRVVMQNKQPLKCFVPLQKRILQTLRNYHNSILTTTMSWKLPHRTNLAWIVYE